MDRIISCCGLICSECPAFIAHNTDDNELREKTAGLWSKFYNADITREMVNCEGCHSNGILFSHCNECAIRQCCHERQYEHCSECEDYICSDKLKPLLDAVPEAKSELDKLRN